MSGKNPGTYKYKTTSPGWMHDRHPVNLEETSTVTFCYMWEGNLCSRKQPGYVTNSREYYVYYLHLTACHFTYCATL